MKKFALALLSLALAHIGIAQPLQSHDIWKLYKSSEGVEVYTRDIECEFYSNQYKYTAIRVINTTNLSKSITWENRAYFDNKCVGCGSGEAQVNIVLAPNQMIEGGCNSDAPSTFQILTYASNMPDLKAYSHIELFGLSVKNNQ